MVLTAAVLEDVIDVSRAWNWTEMLLLILANTRALFEYNAFVISQAMPI